MWQGILFRIIQVDVVGLMTPLDDILKLAQQLQHDAEKYLMTPHPAGEYLTADQVAMNAMTLSNRLLALCSTDREALTPPLPPAPLNETPYTLKVQELVDKWRAGHSAQWEFERDLREATIVSFSGGRMTGTLQQLVGYAWHQADRPCERVPIKDKDRRRCIDKEDDLSWMCHTCWARAITYGIQFSRDAADGK